MSKLAWLDEIEQLAEASERVRWSVTVRDPDDDAIARAKFMQSAPTTVLHLCRAVRELYEALQAVVEAERDLTLAEEAEDMEDPSDEFSAVGRATARMVEAMQQAEFALKRWGRGGDDG